MCPDLELERLRSDDGDGVDGDDGAGDDVDDDADDIFFISELSRLRKRFT